MKSIENRTRSDASEQTKLMDLYVDPYSGASAALYREGRRRLILLTEELSSPDLGSAAQMFEPENAEDLSAFLKEVVEKGRMTKEAADEVLPRAAACFDRLFRPDAMAPVADMSMDEYEELALAVIRREYPKVDHTAFSGRYHLAFWNSLTQVEVIDRHCAWEYPGMWYPGPIRVTNEKLVELLIADAKETLEKNT